VGFGIFYAGITMAASYGPSWLIAATWQVTIVAGALLTPLFYRKADSGSSAGNVARVRHTLPVKQLVVSVFILTGIVLVQLQEVSATPDRSALVGIVLVLVAAFAYPLGNRKMMAVVPPDFGTMERVFGMTLCSLPFWLVLSAAGLALGRHPTPGQFVQTFVVAVFSGVIATILFFRATELVQDDERELAVVESTQAGEVVFALLGGVVLFKDALPTPAALFGIAVVVAGIFLNAALTKKIDQADRVP
jgi:drug/metabolite transporter (DMT)-like permease